MADTFEAEFDSTCRACDNKIFAGDLICYHDSFEVAIHIACARKATDPPVCTTCWLAHVGECP